MKREVLKKYIDSWEAIQEYKKSRFYYYEEGIPISGSIQNLDLKIKKEIQLPKLEGIKKELEILKREMTDALLKKEEAENFLKSECNCNHEVTICNVEKGVFHYVDTCCLCGKKFWDSTIHDNGYSIDTIDRKNNKHAVFEGITITGDDCFEYDYETYYTKKEIRKIIKDILNNSSSEDIDLVDEINKLNLDHCIINYPKNTTLILMIIGSNRFYLDENSYVSHKYFEKYIKIIEHFQSMYNTVIKVLGSEDALKSLKQEPNSLLLSSYEKLSQLETSLNWSNKNQYNLIINMSNLFKYEIKDNKIVTTNYKLNLDKTFNNTPILNIHDLDVLTPDNICSKAKSLIKVRGINE